jgi:hypothetical protein
VLWVTQGPPSNYAYFQACLKRNLRLAISMNPAAGGFQQRMEQNPALSSCCTMLWWQGWTNNSLLAIAKAGLQVTTSPAVHDGGRWAPAWC